MAEGVTSPAVQLNHADPNGQGSGEKSRGEGQHAVCRFPLQIHACLVFEQFVQSGKAEPGIQQSQQRRTVWLQHSSQQLSRVLVRQS
jgi:hypothetical protein